MKFRCRTRRHGPVVGVVTGLWDVDTVNSNSNSTIPSSSTITSDDNSAIT